MNYIIGVLIVSMLAFSAVDHGFEYGSGQIIDYKIDICYFLTKQAALRRYEERLVSYTIGIRKLHPSAETQLSYPWTCLILLHMHVEFSGRKLNMIRLFLDYNQITEIVNSNTDSTQTGYTNVLSAI